MSWLRLALRVAVVREDAQVASASRRVEGRLRPGVLPWFVWTHRLRVSRVFGFGQVRLVIGVWPTCGCGPSEAWHSGQEPVCARSLGLVVGAEVPMRGRSERSRRRDSVRRAGGGHRVAVTRLWVAARPVGSLWAAARESVARNVQWSTSVAAAWLSVVAEVRLHCGSTCARKELRRVPASWARRLESLREGSFPRRSSRRSE